MKKQNTAIAWARGLGGAVIGAVAGYLISYALTKVGLHGAVIPGAMIGLGFGVASGMRSIGGGFVCAIAAAAFGIWVEWHLFPFLEDDSFTFFVNNLGGLPIGTRIMLIGGVLIGFWFGMGRDNTLASARIK